MLAPLDSLPSHSGDNSIMGVDRGPVVIAFPYPLNFILAESLRWLHLIVYLLIPEIILVVIGVG